MKSDESDPWHRFERNRLALFAEHGVAGRSGRIPDHWGRETYAVVCGDGSLPTVLVHGGLSDASEWALLAGRLDGPLVIPDRPGYGLTYRIDYRKLDFRRAAADWLLELVDGLGVETVDLLGASMGGFFALAFATSHPERVRRLVLLGAPVGLFREIPLFLRLWGNPIVGRLISRINIPDAETLRKRAFAGLVVHPERVPVEFLEVAQAGGALPGTALTTRTMLHAVTSLRGLRPGLWMAEISCNSRSLPCSCGAIRTARPDLRSGQSSVGACPRPSSPSSRTPATCHSLTSRRPSLPSSGRFLRRPDPNSRRP
jgi:pimeloyl-ACP methyl ester carboxylesterase